MTARRSAADHAAETPATQAKGVPERADGGGEARQPPRAAEPSDSAPGLWQLLRFLGTIVAPTTLLTALLFYFGWSHAYWFFDYFGVNSTLLGLTTRDYMQRSVDGLFVPMTVAACAGLLLLWGHTVIRSHLAGSRSRLVRVLIAATAMVGLVLAAGGLASVFAQTVLDEYLAAAPLCLAVGVVLVAYAVHLWRFPAARGGERPSAAQDGKRSPAAREKKADSAAAPDWGGVAGWAGVFVLVGLSLFWAANDYSAAVGRSRASQFVAELPSYPSAVLYSTRSLSLDAPGVREVHCEDPDAFYRFRYEGLKLMLQSGDQYVFLPEAWSRTDGAAIVIPRNDSLRLEFFPASSRGSAQRATC